MAEEPSSLPSTTRQTRHSLIILAVIGIALTATTIPGVFIIDEDNYLISIVSLRHGGFVIPGIDSLTRSRELAYFDPEPHRREVIQTPLVSLVAPLYSFIALPFSYFGVWGLVMLNILAFLLTAFILFRLTHRIATSEATPWVVMGTFLAGSYSIEYAQGVWPHMLSALLCVAAFSFLVESMNRAFPRFALFAGLAVGIAAGVREQNIVVAGCLGLASILFAQSRYRTTGMYLLGLAGPLVLIALLNHLKVGLFHPVPKVYGYLADVSETQTQSSFLEPLKVFLAKVVDFSFSGPIQDPTKAALFHRAPGSGAVLIYGIVKKSLIQSAPWVGLTFIGIILAWFAKIRMEDRVRNVLRTISLVVFPTLLMISLAGFNRTDALSFNQRYMLELLPLCALGLGLLIEGGEVKFGKLLTGLILGALLVVAVLNLPAAYSRYIGQLRIPIFLSAALILIWLLSLSSIYRSYLSIAVGVAVGWSLLIHLQTDLTGSRVRRQDNYQRYLTFRNVLPEHSALFAYWGNKDAAGPLQLNRDIVILDLWADRGVDAPRLADELLAQRRRVFILAVDIPKEMLERIVASRPHRLFSESFMNFIEILDRPSP
jgi:hypothetical protein